MPPPLPRRPIKAMLGMIACMVGIVVASTWMSTRPVRKSPPTVPEYSVEGLPVPPPSTRPMPITFFSLPGATTRPAVPNSSWLIVSIAVSLPLLIGSRYLRYRWRKQRRRITGRCLSCGSQLRGSVDQCPECGGTFIEQFPEKLN